MTENLDIRLGQQCSNIGLGYGHIEDTPRIFQPRLGRAESCRGRSFALGALSADLKQLVDRRNGVVPSAPEIVSSPRGGGMIVEIDHRRRKRQRGIGKFASDNFLRCGNVHVALGGEQIPVVFKAQPLRVCQAAPHVKR